MEIVRWSAAEARRAIAAPDLERHLGAAHGTAGVIVTLDDTDPGDEIAAALTLLPLVAIGAGTAAGRRWDIATEVPDPVAEGLLWAPGAAVLTAQTLRGHEQRTPSEGLLLESLAYATLQAGPEFATWLAGQGRRVRRDDQPRIRVEETTHETTVVLDRPRLRNLLDARMRDELSDALRALAFRPEQSIRIVGTGSAFCAGGDPAEFGSVSDSVAAHLIRASANVAPHLLRVADRTIAEISGPCVGAGVELAAFCHRVIAHRDARFRLPETRMGLMPGAGGTVSIPARIGRQNTLEWLLTGVEVDADQAKAWGLVDALIDD